MLCVDNLVLTFNSYRASMEMIVKMKRSVIYLLFAVMICSVCSCSKDELVPEVVFPSGELNYFQNSLDFDRYANEKTITFNSNVPWNVSVDGIRDGSNWCTVSPSSGDAGTVTLKISVQENKTYDDRNAVVRFAYGDSIKNIFVNQKQLDALTLTSDRFEVPVSGGEVKVEVKSNIDYQVKIADECKDWIHQISSATRGLTSSTLTFKIDSSTEYDKREGSIDILSGDKKETVKVYQVGEGILTLTKKEFNLSSAQQRISIEVSSNFEYVVDMPQVDWISEDYSQTRSISTHTINLLIKENTSYDNRSAILRFYDKNSELSEEVIVNQSQFNALLLDKKEYTFDENGGGFTVNVNSNIDYETSIGSNWITETTLPSTKSLVASNRTFMVSEMFNGDSEREAKISFINKENGITENVVVRQINTFFIDTSYVKMNVDGSQQIRLTNNTGQNVTWQSSDNSIVTVDENGNIKAIARGTANVCVSTVDGKHKRECQIVVKDITDYITVYCGGGSIVSINGLIRYGSTFNWHFVNSSNSSVKLLSLQLIDGQTGSVGNEMTIDRIVSSGERVGYTVTVGLLGIHAPVTCRYKYEYNGKSYISEAVYSD